MSIAIWWCRRDLRLTDNAALHAAIGAAESVIPLYILDPALLNSERNRGPRIAWMLEGLHILDQDLRRIGSRLIVRRGKPEVELSKFAIEVGAATVYFNRDYSPYATARDSKVTNALTRQGIEVYHFKDLVIHEADETLTRADKPYAVYGPFRNAWNALPKPSTLNRSEKLHTPGNISSLPIPEAAEFGAEKAEQPITAPGEGAALASLSDFMADSVYDYKAKRNLPAQDGTAILSPYLRWGMISPRTCYWAAQQALENAPDKTACESVEAWIGELVWREFYYQVLARNPQVTQNAYRPVYDAIQWQSDPALFDAWKAGQTGYPIVDAAMRQMNITGWMHNRCRMIAASFLCKDLLIDWRMGERYFMQRLFDGDLANNNGGWQWTAGTGTDAAPYFRVFNPALQAKKFDADGAYVRRWIPELQNIPARFIHEPHTMSRTVQEASGCIIGQDYSVPIVDHRVQRGRVLALYRAAQE